MASGPPPAAGVRIPWAHLPGAVRVALADWLGAPVARATTIPGGFSPGAAERIETADGRSVFMKACGPVPNPDSPDIHRREARVAARLPESAPVPRLLWSTEVDGWVMLVFEYIDGHNPVVPWRQEELDRVIEALQDLSVALTPPPIEADPASEAFATNICGWQLLQHEPLPGLDEWSLRHLDRLAALESRAPDAACGNTLLHFDIRADNLVLTPDRVFVVDWPHPVVGAAWVDLLGFLPSVAMQGGPPPETLLQRYPLARDADPEAVNAVIASLAGYFTQRALLPPPPGLPTLRAFQAAQGTEARRWLAQRTGWT